MPELPEVETVCRGLARAIEGDSFVALTLRRRDLRFPFPRNLSKNVCGKIRRIYRRAKYILIDLDNGRTLIVHLGMTGRMLIVPPAKKSRPAPYKPEKHDHAVFTTQRGTTVIFNDARRFGLIDIAPTADITTHRFFRHLGPEPLDAGFTAAFLAQRLAGRKTPVKIAIMDQELVVGVGNIYAAEALFDAGIDPRRQAGTLTVAECRKLAAAIRAVLKKAIRAGGSSLRDYVQTDGELGYFQHHWAVYDKKGLACRGCACPAAKTSAAAQAKPTDTDGVQRVTQAGRSTFYCPYKQK